MVTRSHIKENAMSALKLVVVIAALASVAGCRQSTLIKPANKVPVARAQILGPDGKLARMAQFDYNGSDVQVTLDATESTDDDGKVVKYRWLSGNAVPDGGVGQLTHEVTTDGGSKTIKAGGRSVPAGQGPDWPGSEAKVTVTLGEGIWTFNLWVIDNGGAISDVDRATVTIGKPDPLTDPKVKMCVDNVYEMVAPSCKTCICNQSDTCRAAVTKDKCDANCWGLISCIGSKCPNFAAMAASMDYSCLTTNCMAFLSGATGATAAGMCITTSCLSDCAAGIASSSSGGAAAGTSGGTPDAGH
jgi:hypothetical protein